jgi:hypothetical protein
MSHRYERRILEGERDQTENVTTVTTKWEDTGDARNPCGSSIVTTVTTVTSIFI